MNRTMEKDNFRDHIDRLKASPVYSMSLGSKELFHSNFWAFLIGTKEYRGLINAFFPDFSLEAFEKVTREDGHRDLTIYDKDGREFVIENKIKSYPDEDQLKRYGNESKNFASGAITGIKNPPFELEKWRFVSYAEIAAKLKELNGNVADYKHDVVNDYCNVLESIDALMSMALGADEGYLAYWNEKFDAALKEVKLIDVFKKNKADDFVKYLSGCRRGGKGENHMDKYKKWEKNGIRFYTEKGFYNCKATLSFGFYVGEDKKSCRETIGVQIEENQFRLYKWNSGMSADEVFKEYSEKGWFDPSYDMYENRMVHGYKTKMKIRSKYCKYGGDWVYQYFDLWPEGSDVNYGSYDTIAGLLDKFLAQAFALLDPEKE